MNGDLKPDEYITPPGDGQHPEPDVYYSQCEDTAKVVAKGRNNKRPGAGGAGKVNGGLSTDEYITPPGDSQGAGGDVYYNNSADAGNMYSGDAQYMNHGPEAGGQAYTYVEMPAMDMKKKGHKEAKEAKVEEEASDEYLSPGNDLYLNMSKKKHKEAKGEMGASEEYLSPSNDMYLDLQSENNEGETYMDLLP